MNKKTCLQTIFALFAVALAGALPAAFGEGNFSVAANASAVSLRNSEAELDILDLVNAERRKKRLTELDWDDDLAKLARNYSRQMARGDFFSHFDADGDSVVERANAARIKNWRKIGENLFYCEGIRDYSETAVHGWLKSASHRRNMLDREWTDTGIGVARGRNGKIYVTQVFVER